MNPEKRQYINLQEKSYADIVLPYPKLFKKKASTSSEALFDKKQWQK